jgi:glycosyltransferase involved in cell wall biosynthesis
LQAEVDKEENSSGFIFTGSKNNPFPYYKYADISATLSYYEGLCGTVNEAKVMGKCVIATTFSGINEQIINGENGIIVENNENAILEGFRLLLDNEELRKRLSNDYLPEAIKNDCVKIALFDQLLESK